MKINKVRLVNSNMSVAIDYADESGQEHLLILGAENVVKNWQAVEHSMHLTLGSLRLRQALSTSQTLSTPTKRR